MPLTPDNIAVLPRPLVGLTPDNVVAAMRSTLKMQPADDKVEACRILYEAGFTSAEIIEYVDEAMRP